MDMITLLDSLEKRFPTFSKCLRNGFGAPIEQILPAARQSDLDRLERELGVKLPVSYREFLACTRGLWLFGGVIQMSSGHPFFHEFDPFSKLTPAQQQFVKVRGGSWPPPSNGMLCFAEFFMEADGDQVLFDVKKGLLNGEYPVFYYAHEATPPSVRLIAHSFEEWLNEFPDYEVVRV